ncbi:hypothetical protein CYMTET_56853 [Cymbomonas tetramitiformis]|uniref:Uncharacterized protein n=1 Tax=Cymbomonas tetramitiformis TaxID=36881 RepID=A0AAE0BAG2_9CHLO|nr:hypothetical protein CYMTET_56853 [Cymbomonas tetramitiformis]
MKRPPAIHVPADEFSTQAKPEDFATSGTSMPTAADKVNKTPLEASKTWKRVSVMASSRTLVSKGASVGEEDSGKWLPVSENAQKYMNRMETFKAKTALSPGESATVVENAPPLYGSSFASVVEAASKRTSKMQRLTSFLAAPQQRPEAAKLYDPKNTLTNLFTWSGTALQLVFYKPDFWFCLLLHVVLTVVAHVVLDLDWDPDNEVPDGSTTWPKIKDDTMLVMGGILVFFMVFFNGQAYSRFFSQYFLIRKIGYNVQDLFFLTRTHIESPIKQLAIVRRLHAAHYLGFAYMPQNYELPGFVAATYVHLQKIHLLLPSEASDLHASEDTISVHEECLLWLIQVLRKEMAEGNLKPPIYRAFEAKTHAINDEFEELKAYALQPIPFAYYHLMTVLCTAYLVVLAYTSVWVTAYYSIFGYLGSLLALLGLREAAACLSDPLGTDQSDIPVFDMVAEQHFRNVRILTTRPHRWNNLEPVPYFGSKMSLLAIADALQPADFQDATKAPADEEEIEPSRLTGEAAEFWNTLAKGRISKDAQLELQKLNTVEEPPAADDDDDDDDENFEVDDF